MTYFQRGQQHLGPYRGGSGIHELYSFTLTGLTIFFKEVVIKEMTMIRVVQWKHGGTFFAALYGATA